MGDRTHTRLKWIGISALMCLLTPLVSFANSLDGSIRDELKRLNKCYALFVKERIPISHPLWVAVSQGTKTGTQACMELLSAADLNANGLIQNPTNSSNPTLGSKILASFLDFYRMNLGNSDFSNGLGGIRNEEVHDMNTPAYYFLYSTFKPGEAYSRVITSDLNLRAKRYSGIPDRRKRSITNNALTTFDYLSNGKLVPYYQTGNSYGIRVKNVCENNCFFNDTKNMLECSFTTGVYPPCCKECVSSAQAQSVYSVTSNNAASPQILGGFPWYPVLAEDGFLNGIVPSTLNQTLKVVITKYINYWHTEAQMVKKTVEKNRFYEKDASAFFGAGFIGNQAYLMMNNNKSLQDIVLQPNGGPSSYRMWTKNVFSDALCLDTPGLRTSDTLSLVRSNSEFPWRSGMTCMNCHEGYDKGAAAIRNLFTLRSADGNNTQFMVFFANKMTTKPSAPYPELAPDPEFSDRPAEAKLIFRGFDGTLVQTNVTGLAEYGAAIANTRQFYVCGTKRYFEWLTGVPVNIEDTSDILNPVALTPSQKKYRNRVIALADQLKQHQSVKTLLQSIISSELFIKPDQGGD